MATPFDICLTLLANLGIEFVPYLPNSVSFPNPDPRAGTIPMTIFEVGHPIQVHALERLENHMSQVSIFEGAVEKHEPWLRHNEPIGVTTTSATFATDRYLKQIIIQVWSYDIFTREAIVGLIRSFLRIGYFQSEPDGTTTRLRYVGTVPNDFEQTDSVWVSELHYMADATLSFTVDAAIVTEIDTSVAVVVEQIDGTISAGGPPVNFHLP